MSLLPSRRSTPNSFRPNQCPICLNYFGSEKIVSHVETCLGDDKEVESKPKKQKQRKRKRMPPSSATKISKKQSSFKLNESNESSSTSPSPVYSTALTSEVHSSKNPTAAMPFWQRPNVPSKKAIKVIPPPNRVKKVQERKPVAAAAQENTIRKMLVQNLLARRANKPPKRAEEKKVEERKPAAKVMKKAANVSKIFDRGSTAVEESKSQVENTVPRKIRVNANEEVAIIDGFKIHCYRKRPAKDVLK